MRIEASIRINAPAARIFAFIADVERQPEWIGAVRSVSGVSTRPVEQGTTFTLSLEMMGRQATSAQTVTRYEQDRVFAQSTSSGPIPAEITITLSEDGGATTVHNVTEADISSLGRLAGPLVQRTIRHQLEVDLNTLKRLMES